MLNDAAAQLFESLELLDSQDIKKHRPLMVTLNVSSLDQDIAVAEVPAAYPVDSMLPMNPEDEEQLGDACLAVV